MRRLGWIPDPFWLTQSNICLHRGRVLRFSQAEGRLLVTELRLDSPPGQELKSAAVYAGLDCSATTDLLVICCSLGERVLALSWHDSVVSAALVAVDDGPLSPLAVHASGLSVPDAAAPGCPGWPFVCALSESRALLYFDGELDLWHCEVGEGTLVLRKLETPAPPDNGFRTLAIAFPGGRLLAAGCEQQATDLILVSSDPEPRFETLATLPGKARPFCSLALVEGRFVVGFGGANNGLLRDLWVFDTETRGFSLLRRKGRWHPADYRTALVVRESTIYLLGGWNHRCLSAMTFATLADLVRGGRLRLEISQAFGLPGRIDAAYAGEALALAIPGWL